MGVISPYKTFTFDGESSADYGVYLTGEGVFNAPERSVEMVEIPGRNGNFALDKGRFENISVTYRVGMFDDDEENFADKVSAFRNWLCSKVGYVRLSDDYNPNEYRMAVYSGGLEVDHDFLIAGEAQITFDCKPQRWLTSGETAVSVADGGTLDNPTPFEAEPLLAVDGYGTIGFNGYEVEIGNVPIGDITLYDGGQWNAVVLDESNLNVGDTITVNAKMLSPFIETVLTQSMSYNRVRNVSITCSGSGYTATFGSHATKSSTDHLFYIDITPTSFTLVSGTNSTITNNVSGSFEVIGSPNGFTLTFSFTQTYTYTASTHTLTYNISNISVSSSVAWCTPTLSRGMASYYSIVGDSTKSAISDTVYIDCDIGECWTIQNGNIVSLNGVISLGSDLPKLSSGTNTFTYDNTVTELKVTPRYWKV